MSEVLVSLHGRKAGLDKDGRMLVPGGFRAGPHGAQRDMGSIQTVAFFDDFMGDVLADEFNGHGGANASGVAAAIVASIDGAVRLVGGSAPSGTFAQNSQLLDLGQMNYRASDGGLVMEAAVKMSRITTSALFVGFTDQVSALENPFSLGAADALTSNCSDGCGFLFDTGADTDHLFLVGVAGDTDATVQSLGTDPATASFRKFRVEIATDGSATFFIDGVLVGTKMTGAVTAATALTPVIMVWSQTSTLLNVDVDYFYAAKARA